MPDLKIPTFDGWYYKTEYTKVEKFQYLGANLSALAKQCNAGFPVTIASYGASYKLLEERFGIENIIIHVHMRQFTKIKSALQ